MNSCCIDVSRPLHSVLSFFYFSRGIGVSKRSLHLLICIIRISDSILGGKVGGFLHASVFVKKP